MTEVAFRPLETADLDHIKWALYTAVAWNPDRELPPFEVVVEHPELARYHRDWGRPGDLAVAAEFGDAVVGVALCRIFTDEDHGQGYVDPETPEIAVAVKEGHRGRGIGGQLRDAIAEAAWAAGFARLSLSVDAENPARRLYERAGYRELSVDEGDVRMLREL